ncbi:MAG: MG2 domain-containing protein [Anaerobiospirillum succiniciproducens]|uniref:alpha-2-macroglobulin family protein n=1 Tax=Anaerobiospirillum succiniciproducens TaxID=13335 RepID=UPI0026DC4A4F|nr:MG2 domain-containing protein [Anaerobiospirillum succiniciproducens]MDO4676684.1 MG2 domain-containing protein [Anaerobiospirillum succiniciproducens]
MLAKPLSLKASSLSKTPLALALSLAMGTISTALWPAAVNAEPNITVLKTLEMTNSSPATVCLTMSGRQVVDDSFSNLSKNVKVTLRNQPVDVPVAVTQGNLCIDKLESGKTYNVLLKKGLKFKSGSTLEEPINHKVTISDSVAQIKLPYNIILPKNGANDSFTVKTVNQSAFKLSIFRIPPTVLDNYDLTDLEDSEMSMYMANHFMTNLGRPVYERIFDISKGTSVDVFEAKQALQKAENEGKALIAADGSTPEDALKAQVDAAKKSRISDEMRNQVKSTEIKLKDFVSKSDHGMYLIVATDPRVSYTNGFSYSDMNNKSLPITVKMMMITDLGMTTYRAQDGILVNVRSLTSAKALKDVKLKLIANNGEVLAQTKTNKEGTGSFAKEFVTGKNALAPAKILAEGKNDYFIQNLSDDVLYLEDNQGSKSNSNYEVYAYTDRGIYRPNETVHYTALLRNKHLQAVNLPLTLKIVNSYGSELSSHLLSDSAMGGYSLDFKIPQGTVNGRYNAMLYLGDTLLEDTAFTIGSYVPTQINTAFINNEGVIPVNTPFKLKTATKFNYGGTASNLSGSMRITLRPDQHPVPAAANAANNPFLKKFHFGPDQREFTNLTKTEVVTDLKSDAEGVMTHEVSFIQSRFPQKARVSASAFDTSGQEVSTVKTFKVAYNNPLIGVRRLDDAKKSSDKAEFTLCSYLQDGSTYPQDVKYYLFKEFVDYNFVYENGTWRYVVFHSRNLVHQGTVKVDNQSLDKALISADLEDGSYVLELESPKSATTLSFVKGFSSSMDNRTPDRVAVYADQESYLPGDKMMLSFDSPFDGYANLAIGSEGIQDFRTFKVNRGHNEVDIQITEDLYPQGHALLSLFSPIDESTAGIIRAVGLVDINMNSDVHKFNVTTSAADEIKPGSTFTVKVNAQKADEAKQDNSAAQDNKTATTGTDGDKITGYARVTLVDNGILGLTKYAAPDPNKVFMQDRAYQVDVYDPYSMLIRDPKQQGQGYGDGAEDMMAKATGAMSLDTVSFKTVALASQIVPLDANGQAEVTFDVPKFSGSLKYMTVAWDENRTGASNADVTVRDKAVATIGLPRYLNVGDTVQARLNLHNLKAKNHDFKVDISCEGALKCSMQSKRTLKPGIREDNYFDVTAISDGIGKVNLTVINPDYKYTDSFPLQVTYPQMAMLKSYVAPVDAKSSAAVAIGANDFNDIDDVLINLSSLPFVNPVALTAELDKGEDTSISGLAAELESKLLYGSTLVATAESLKQVEEAQDADEALKAAKPYANAEQLNAKIQEIIFRLLARQRSSGSFYSWSDIDSLYAADVIIKASEAGHNVNADALERAITYVRSVAATGSDLSPYALSILSTFESINQAEVRRMLDEYTYKKPFALAQLAIALNNIGDKARAKIALNQAMEGLQEWQSTYNYLLGLESPTDTSALELIAQLESLQVEGQYNLREVAFRVINAAQQIGMYDTVVATFTNLHAINTAPDYISATEAAAKIRADYSLTGGSNVESQRALLSSDEITKLMQPVAKASADNASADKQAADKASAADAAANLATAANTEANTSADASSEAMTQDAALGDKLYTVSAGKVSVNNTSSNKLYANVTVLGQYKHDKIISNKGFFTKVNLFNRDGAIDQANYVFQPNEEVLMEIFVDKNQLSNDDIIVKAKIPAGFEFVRRMKRDDPSFGALFDKDDSYSLFPDISDFSTSDDTISALFRRYNVGNSFSLFVVLRAAHPGTFTQGESMVQYKTDPGVYGTFMSDTTITVAKPGK